MEIKDMIQLAKDGVSATDILALNKAGFTPEIIEELKNNELSTEQIKEEVNQQETERQETEKSNQELMDQLQAAALEIDNLKEQIKNIQDRNRGEDQTGDLPDPNEANKNLQNYIASKM